MPTSPTNLLSLTTVNADTATLECTASYQQLLAAPATNHVRVVDAIFCSNVHENVVGSVSIILRDDSGSPTIDFLFLNQKRLAVKDKVNVLDGRSLYLREGISVWVKANQANNVNVSAPFSDSV